MTTVQRPCATHGKNWIIFCLCFFLGSSRAGEVRAGNVNKKNIIMTKTATSSEGTRNPNLCIKRNAQRALWCSLLAVHEIIALTLFGGSSNNTADPPIDRWEHEHTWCNIFARVNRGTNCKKKSIFQWQSSRIGIQKQSGHRNGYEAPPEQQQIQWKKVHLSEKINEKFAVGAFFDSGLHVVCVNWFGPEFRATQQNEHVLR